MPSNEAPAAKNAPLSAVDFQELLAELLHRDLFRLLGFLFLSLATPKRGRLLVCFIASSFAPGNCKDPSEAKVMRARASCKTFSSLLEE